MSHYPEAIEALTSEYAEANEITDITRAFQRMTTELVLRQYNLLPEELDDGDVDGYMDGGIDGFYLFVNGMYVDEDDKVVVKNISDKPKIEVFLIQNKYTNCFTEEAELKLFNVASRILDENDDMGGVKQSVGRKKKLFHGIWRKLISKMPVITFSVLYITKADPDKRFKSVRRLVEIHRKSLEERQYGEVKIDFELINSLDLYNLKKKGFSYTKELVISNRITAEHAEIVTVTLESYYNFITQPSSPGNGDVREIAAHLFDDNVRDFQGGVTVNQNILETLKDPESKQFWWYNNGITIICSDATGKGNTYTLKDVQIVNGLQTSYCIYNSRASNPNISNFDNRHVLVKIIITEDSAIRDSVIKATNSQTGVNAWSLYATDRIQRLIEDYFLLRGLFYDRRKGYYRNSGKPLSKIVSINFVGQCMIAMGLSQPDTARARPNMILGDRDQYRKVFDESIDLDLYLLVTKFQKRVESVIRDNSAYKPHYTDIRFYVSSYLCTYFAQQRIVSPKQLTCIADELLVVENDVISAVVGDMVQVLSEYSSSVGSDLSKVAKSKEFREHVIGKALHDASVGLLAFKSH